MAQDKNVARRLHEVTAFPREVVSARIAEGDAAIPAVDQALTALHPGIFKAVAERHAEREQLRQQQLASQVVQGSIETATNVVDFTERRAAQRPDNAETAAATEQANEARRTIDEINQAA